jgi:hypothetical protein
VGVDGGHGEAVPTFAFSRRYVPHEFIANQRINPTFLKRRGEEMP